MAPTKKTGSKRPSKKKVPKKKEAEAKPPAEASPDDDAIEKEWEIIEVADAIPPHLLPAAGLPPPPPDPSMFSILR